MKHNLQLMDSMKKLGFYDKKKFPDSTERSDAKKHIIFLCGDLCTYIVILPTYKYFIAISVMDGIRQTPNKEIQLLHSHGLKLM